MTICDGASTSFTRQQLAIPKSHTNDAACLDLPQKVHNMAIPTLTLKRQRRHKRQSIDCNAHGSPSSRHFPAYSKLPQHQQGYTTPPSHSTGPRRLRGIRTGDIVRIQHHSGHAYTGRATAMLRQRTIQLKRQGPDGTTVSATPAHTTLIAHATRWAVSSQRTR